jgi:hypothetical protein
MEKQLPLSGSENTPTSLFAIAAAGLAPIFVAALLVGVRGETTGGNLALVLVIVVVLAAALGGRAAGATAAVLAAVSYDFFLTQPYLSLAITSRDDIETTVLLLIVGVIVGTVSARAAKARASAAASHTEIRRIHRVAERMAAGDDPSDVIAVAQQELHELLSLEEARFESLPATSALPRLERSGVINTSEYRYRPEGFELPDGGVELPVLSRGRPVGRFVLVPRPGIGHSLDQRVVAVAIADQVGAALAASPTNP